MEESKINQEKSTWRGRYPHDLLEVSTPSVSEKIVRVVQTMFTTTADHWDDIVKVRLIIPLHKKGAEDNPDT